MLKAGFGTPFAEELEFFRQKLNVPTERYDDIRREAHDRAFMVAGAMKADLLDDLRRAVDKAIAEGKGHAWFKKEFLQIAKKHGWTGWTGEGSKAGQAWRTKVVLRTNRATAYAAGRYQQMTDPEFLKRRPYWRYVHADYVANPRPHHLAWDGITLPYDHPMWQTHFAPNGHGCQCRVIPVDAREYEKAKAAGKAEPPAGWENAEGIDPGFAYAPGANVSKSFKSLIDDKLIKLDAPIGAAMYEALRPVLAKEMRRAVEVMVDGTAAAMQSTGRAALVHVVSPRTVAALASRNLPLESADVWLRDEELLHALRNTKDERGAALPLSAWRDLPALLDGATPYFDTQDPALVYAFDLPNGVGKVLVRVNYADKVRQQGKRTRITSNFVRTGGIIEPKNISNGTQYIQLEK